MLKTSGQICVFTRWPVPGHAKTRLIPALGPDGAAALQQEMTQHTLTTVRAAHEKCRLEISVRFTGGTVGDMREWLGPDLVYTPQGDGDLGARMLRAIRESGDAGHEFTMIIGTDCPQLSVGHLCLACELMGSHDLVLGPAQDGGYYLIGLHHPSQELFDDMPWGTDRVLELTLGRARSQGLRVAQLETLSDIDRPEDLPKPQGPKWTGIPTDRASR